jgi:hypothetical protein
MTSTISKRARLWGSLLVAGAVVPCGCGTGEVAVVNPDGDFDVAP